MTEATYSSAIEGPHGRCPTNFKYWESKDSPEWSKRRALFKKLTKHEAYQLVSVAGNVSITQLVDRPNVGVHVKIPKSIFTVKR